MNPYIAPKLPFKFVLDEETKKLVRNVYFKYGEYKYALHTLKYDYKHFLDIMLFTDALCTSSIEFEKLSIEDIFYVGYLKEESKVKLIDNLRRSFVYAYQYSKKKPYDLEFFNKMNKTMLKKTGLPYSEIGHIRKKTAYVMKLGLVGKSVDYIAPSLKDIKPLMKNLIKYINCSGDEPFIKMAISHYQFLIIHPYDKGNGRIARIMLPIEFNRLLGEEPILFMSEIFSKNQVTYRRVLNEVREDNNPLAFIKFFLRSIIEMCDHNIEKIEKINKICEEDFEYIKKEVGGTLIYKVYPYIVKNVVFSIPEIVEELHLHINSANKVLKNLVGAGVLEKEKREGCNRVTYKYTKIFNVFIKLK